jgi:carbon monoxide dehydrogenase subunit G
MAITETLQIAAPPQRVWKLIDDVELLRLWMPEVEETSYPDGPPASGGVGVRFTQKIREGGVIRVYDGAVIAYEEGRVLGISLADARFTMHVRYALSPSEAGTRLDYACDIVEMGLLMRPIMFFAMPMVRSTLSRQMNSLRRVAESPAAA